MGICDAHEAAWGSGSPKKLSSGEGYLLAAQVMQKSVIQDKLIDQLMSMAQAMGMGSTHEQCRLQVESNQGTSPWLICEQCVDLLRLSQDDKDAAREAAIKWWRDKDTPGHIPGKRAATRNKKPACFKIFGNGFMPSEEQARFIILAWLDKRKGLLGEDAAEGVRADIVSRPKTSRMKFLKVVPEVQKSLQGQVTDDILRLDQITGRDMALVAIWAPEDSNYIRSLLKKESR